MSCVAEQEPTDAYRCHAIGPRRTELRNRPTEAATAASAAALALVLCPMQAGFLSCSWLTKLLSAAR